jgi:excisionase family DNA binding protein
VKRTVGSSQPDSPPNDFLSRSEVSKMLGVSPNTVTRWAREGRLPCHVTLGGHHRFERAVVEQIQKDLTRGGGGRVG